VEKLLPWNIQCQVPANRSAALAGSGLACGLVPGAEFALANKEMLVIRESAIAAARTLQRLFSVEIMIRSSKLFLHAPTTQSTGANYSS